MYYNAFQTQKIGKKVLALVLALMMVISLMVSANAAITFDDAADINPQYQEAVEVLQTLGIMQGVPTEVPATEEGAEPTTVNNFQPKTPLTRAQFAVILFKLATGDDGDEEAYEMYKAQNIYSDVPSTNYAAAHINYLNKIDAMHGIGGGKFDPDREVTGYEVVQGLLQALGYGKLGEFGDSWEDAKLVTAAYGTSKHITTGLGIDIRKVVTREELAALLFNALTQPEAHRVTAVAADGKHYVEENAASSTWVTIGEANWELHLYTRSSGSKYPSDKEISVSLDPFGRPTNPKWVARVDGKVVTIGTENKALIEYYQKDAVTRQKLTNDFYTEFAFKDLNANTEYYVDGLLVEDPWTHVNKDTHAASAYDTIGGTGVTIEVYMMADNYVAIDKDLVNEASLRYYGDTKVDGENATWPRMRVVIVHHYAAMLTSTMMIEGNTAASDDDYIEVPYDEVQLTTCAICGAKHYNTAAPTTKRVAIANNDKYKVGDVVYFDVANAYNKDNDLIHTAYNDHNLTAEKCFVTGPVEAIDPYKEYIRIKDMPEDNALVAPGGALYYNYFMQTTSTKEYNKESVKKTTTDQTVYLEPKNKQFAALIYTKQDPKTYENGDYYYVDEVEVRLGRDATIFNDSDIIILANLVNVVTHERVTKQLSYTLDKSGRNIISIAGHYLFNPINIRNDIILNGNRDTTSVWDSLTWAGHYYKAELEDKEVYDLKEDTHYVEVHINDAIGGKYIDNTYLAYLGGLPTGRVSPTNPATVRLYDNLDLGVEVTRWYYLANAKNQLVLDDAGNPVIFAIVKCPDGVERTVIWDRYKKDGLDSGSLNNAAVGSNPEVDPNTTPTTNVSGNETEEYAGRHIYVVYNQAHLSHQYREIPINPSEITEKNALTVTNSFAVKLGNLGGQFVFYDEGTKMFDYDVQQTVKSCYAYDDDNSLCFDITSGNFILNETSSRVNVKALHTPNYYFDNIGSRVGYHTLDEKDIVTHFADEHGPFDPDLGKKEPVYVADPDATVLVTEDTKIISYVGDLDNVYYDWQLNNDGTVKTNPATGKPYETHKEVNGKITYVDTYSFNEFDRFGITDRNPDVLVITYKDAKGTETAKYIVVIADAFTGSTAIDHYTYHGILYGFNEYSESQVEITLLNPQTNKPVTFVAAKSVVSDIDYNHIGYVFGVTATGDTVTAVKLVKEPEQVKTANYSYIETTTEYHELVDPTYIYVGRHGGWYVSKVSASYVDLNRADLCAYVYDNADGTNTVVIWPKDLLEGYKDGHPNYGSIDVNWDLNTHGDPDWEPEA